MLRILYHADFDGMASAAVLGQFVRETMGLNELNFVPVDHHMAPEWTQARPPAAGTTGPFAVVDFLYHPEADLWFDHHPTTFSTPEYARHAQDRIGEPGVHLDIKARSCTSLILTRVAETWGERAADFADLAERADQIDQAEYASPEAFFRAEEPHVRIDQARRFATTGQIDQVIRQFMVPDLVAAEELLEQEATRAVDLNQQALSQYPQHQRRVGDVVVADVVNADLPFLRFAGYYTHPTATYSVTLYRGAQGSVRVGMNKNPWLDVHHWPLGRLARDVGGGGHSYAAGADFTRAVYQEPYVAAVQWVSMLVQHLQQPVPQDPTL